MCLCHSGRDMRVSIPEDGHFYVLCVRKKRKNREDVPSAGLIEIDRIQPSSEPVLLTCFTFQNATADENGQSIALSFLQVRYKTQARTLLFDEDLYW
jgi:hypothetical protein